MRRFLLALIGITRAFAGDLVFHEPFVEALKPGWKWVREDKSAWRLRDGALEIHIQPGNMWGPENSGKNVLVRPLPDPLKSEVIASMTVENFPTHQYEQTDLVCYYDDSHMVKIGQELVDGKLSIVMGREEKDRTRTIAIIPLEKNRVELKLRVQGNTVIGEFRPAGAIDWKTAGQCDLPVHGDLNIAIQCYQGPADAVHWSKIRNFQIERSSK